MNKKFPDSATEWVVTLPVGATGARPIAAWNVDRTDSHNIDGWDFKDGILTITFGFDSHSGQLDYTYDQEQNTSIEQDGNVVNIYMSPKA